MSHSSLKDYYGQIHTLVQHKYSIIDIETRIPWERDLLIDMLAAQAEAIAE